MTAETYIQTQLLASSSMALLISLWTKTSVEYKMIFNGWVIPTLSADSYKIVSSDSATTDLIENGLLNPTTAFNTVNYYRETLIDGSLPYKASNYTINCRAYTQAEAEEIALSVYNSLNKVSDANHNCYCNLEVVIPPQDETDNYNARVTAIFKTKE